jgi:hypothetical protein
MNLKTVIGGVIAALISVVAFFPGVASANEPVVSLSTDCVSGDFSITVDYVGGEPGPVRLYVWIDGRSWDDSFGNGSAPPSGMQVDSDVSSYVADPSQADYFRFDGAASQDNFFVLSGDYQAIADNGGSVTVEVFQTEDVDYVGSFASGADVTASDSVTITLGPDQICHCTGNKNHYNDDRNYRDGDQNRKVNDQYNGAADKNHSFSDQSHRISDHNYRAKDKNHHDGNHA